MISIYRADQQKRFVLFSQLNHLGLLILNVKVYIRFIYYISSDFILLFFYFLTVILDKRLVHQLQVLFVSSQKGEKRILGMVEWGCGGSFSTGRVTQQAFSACKQSISYFQTNRDSKCREHSFCRHSVFVLIVKWLE